MLYRGKNDIYVNKGETTKGKIHQPVNNTLTRTDTERASLQGLLGTALSSSQTQMH